MFLILPKKNNKHSSFTPMVPGWDLYGCSVLFQIYCGMNLLYRKPHTFPQRLRLDHPRFFFPRASPRPSKTVSYLPRDAENACRAQRAASVWQTAARGVTSPLHILNLKINGKAPGRLWISKECVAEHVLQEYVCMCVAQIDFCCCVFTDVGSLHTRHSWFKQ